MLTRLALRDFVVIPRADIAFAPQFCVLTGETGAGKSLLVDALALLAGGRASPALVRPGAAQAEVEIAVDIAAIPATQRELADLNLIDADAPTQLIARRIIGKRPAAYVNGRQTPLAQLAHIADGLIDICGQHAHYSLRAPAAHRPLLDAYAGAQNAVTAVAAAHAAWQNAQNAWQRAAAHASDADRRRAMLSETLAELADLDFSPEKWREQNDILTRTAHISDIAAGCAQALALIQGTDGDGGARAALAKATRILADLGKLDDKLAQNAAPLQDAASLAADAARDITRYADSLAADPQAQAAADVFLADCHRAARKYGLPDPARLADFIADQQTALTTLPTDTDLHNLAQAAAAAKTALGHHCATLTTLRRTAADKLCADANALLARLAMPKAKLTAQFTAQDPPTAAGAEKIAFLVTTRPDLPPGAIANIASGGELSRIGLALQIAADTARGRPIAVFDEVDAGIGGATAATVGTLLRQLGQSRQVLCVTHLPQVAARAHAHWRITGGDAIEMRRLTKEERIEEIARMQSGENITAAARQHAEEMLSAP